VVMKDGIVHQTDTPLNLYNFPVNKFVAGFIGSPAMNFLNGAIELNGGLHFREKNSALTLAVPKEKEASLKNHVGKDVWLGIRPEHIVDLKGDTAPASKATVRVEVVEPIGNEIFVYFSTASDNQYVARIHAEAAPRTGQTMEFGFDMAKSLFFDTTTENVLK
jgi:multiple sugar transport system ATP-binding protein